MLGLPLLRRCEKHEPCLRAANGSHAKLCGRSPRAEAEAARRLPRTTLRRTESRTATDVTPPRLRRRRQLGCRAEAGPHQLQREVRRRPLERGRWTRGTMRVVTTAAAFLCLRYWTGTALNCAGQLSNMSSRRSILPFAGLDRRPVYFTVPSTGMLRTSRAYT